MRESLDLQRLAHEVLLPATSSSVVTPELRDLFDHGCRSVLLGETRGEYVRRQMAHSRIQRETPEVIREFVDELGTHSAGPVLVAVDHELGGIQRLGHLVAPLPSPAQAASLPRDELTERAWRTGLDLAALRVTLALGPIVDVVRGPNPWLHRRNLGPDPDVVSRIGAALVTGLQSAGVVATAKHFPGHAVVRNDPATAFSVVDTAIEQLRQVDLGPFRAVIGCGVQAIMLGPAVVTAIDDARPASLSPAVVQLLRDELGFEGAIVTDDLDARSIVRNGDLGTAAVKAFAAGADLLLVSEERGAECAGAITSAVEGETLQPERLQQAALKVRNLDSRWRDHARASGGLVIDLSE